MRTKPIRVTVKKIHKSTDGCEDRDRDSDPCDGSYFRDITNVRGVQTDDSYEDGGFEASKTTTVARMATPRGSFPALLALLKQGVGGGGNTIGGRWGAHIYIYICTYMHLSHTHAA